VKSLKRMGILGHPKRPQTEPVAEHIEATLQARGIETWHYEEWTALEARQAMPNTDMVVAIGGDGAMLQAARVSAEAEVPVLGLNMGRLGFLTEIASPDDWDKGLNALLQGEYWIEERMMLAANLQHQGQQLTRGNALNDVVISGHSAGSMIQLDLYIDKHWATTYNCDALIIASPTGSTAYALAAGGPILPPDLTNILIIPTASHLSMDRPIVLSEGSEVALRLSEGNRHPALITIDGMQLAELKESATLYIRASEHISRFVRLRERNYFYRSLLDRLEPRVNRSLPEGEKILDEGIL
jgi:NAD+ kinase